MSLNLGQAVEAARQLHTVRGEETMETFTVLREAILEQVRKYMNQALDCPAEDRVDTTAYARALRDVYVALEVGATRLVPNIRPQTDNPGPVAKPPRGGNPLAA